MLSTWTRFGIVLIAAIATLASAGKSNRRTVGTGQESAPPPPRAMSADTALGLWKSSFGAVKIEHNDAATAGTTSVMGVWVYQRGAEEVIGFFKGALRGNVLEFSWQEPGVPAPLVGSGYLVFDPGGMRFDGKWWTSSRDRQGDWSGWREAPNTSQPASYNFEDDRPEGTPVDTTGGGDAYGGSGYGGTSYGGTVYGGGPTSPPPPPPDGSGPPPGPR